jgi:hypothetical protein
LILAVFAEPVKRKPKRVSRAAKQRRLDNKRQHSQKKQNRSGRFGD